MSGCDFQTLYTNVMDGMLKTAVAETTVLFETMVDELKEEISNMKKENEDLKSKCNEFENARNHPTTNITEREVEPGPSNVPDKRDMAVQCELVPLRTMWVEQCYQCRTASVQLQDQQRQHDVNQEEDVEPALICRQAPSEILAPKFLSVGVGDGLKEIKEEEAEPIPADFLLAVDDDHDEGVALLSESPLQAFECPTITESETQADGQMTLLQKDEGRPAVALETPCLTEDSWLVLGGVESPASEPEQISEEPELDQRITEAPTQALSSEAVDAESSTGVKRLKEDSLVTRLRSHLRTCETESSFTETEPSIAPRRSRLTKDGVSPKKTVNEPTPVSPKRPRSSKHGVSPENTTRVPTFISPRRSRLCKDGGSPKYTAGKSSPLSPRGPRLANDGIGPKKTEQSRDAKKPRLFQDVTSPNRSSGLPKAAETKKLKKSNRSKSQNGVETRRQAEKDARRETLKKAKAPPKMSANKSPLRGRSLSLLPLRGRSLSLLPAKGENQAQAPTTPQRRSQTTSPRMVTPPNPSQTIRLKSASKGHPPSPKGRSPSSKGRPPSPHTKTFPPSVSRQPIPVKAPPIESPSEPLLVLGRCLLKNQCGECGRVFKSMGSLMAHVSHHTGLQPFSCRLCGRYFKDSRGLSMHGKVHGRVHVCTLCGKGFVLRHVLTRHVQVIHSGVKNFICHICSRCFSTKIEMEGHIRVHTGETPFPCHLCGKLFKSRRNLNMHLRRHNGEKRYWCPYCQKGFLDFNHLKAHKYIHTGEKPHACPLCPKTFRQTGHLKKHVRNVHKSDMYDRVGNT